MKLPVSQVTDDLQLLQQMMADESSAPEIFRATNYWSVYRDRLVPELQRIGLKDFRRRNNSVLSSFGAPDLKPKAEYLIDSSRWPLRCLSLSNQKMLIQFFLPIIYRMWRKRLFRIYFDQAQSYGAKFGAVPLSKFSATMIGNPEEVFEKNGNLYTYGYLSYYMQYAYTRQFVDFKKISSFVELGPGCGKQIEILKRLYPHITFYLFDITPQLYVCEQFLKAIFPGEVLSYRDTRSATNISKEWHGKICILGAWQLPLIQDIAVDVFWNSASFQEMEPDVVANYLSYVVIAAKYIYLRERISGQWVSKDPREGGVLKKVTLKDYVNALQGFRLLDISKSATMGYSSVKYCDYYDCVWEKVL